MRKLQNRRGETLVETLTALLIATLVILFLATAVVTAARVNKKVRDNDVSFKYEDTEKSSDNLELTVTWDGGSEEIEDVQEYITKKDTDGKTPIDWTYRYYTYKKSN